ncbi:SHOCT domain-containing protein [Bifidobacterium polysaccharolyticum]|uniref:SHOCT domain-containing protein n=1 Tax=Bifidobacterium polysaccharolyticum TaxID=2750967 RepID=UPI0021BB0FCA|nr:SHOCT domain-containing protein [Bifidobacterium polysaccharolyticum]MCT8158184.1 SHOCT domain-containing protein [Bifidobacterium polysaccharolyticum]
MGLIHHKDDSAVPAQTLTVKTNRARITIDQHEVKETFDPVMSDQYSSPEVHIPLECLRDAKYQSKWSGWYIVLSVQFEDGTMSDAKLSENNPYTPSVGITQTGKAKRFVETLHAMLPKTPKPLPEPLKVAHRKKAGIMDEFKTDGRLSMISGKDRSQLLLYGDHISDGAIDRPLYGVQASLDDAGNARKRVTATRAAAVGVLALAAKKAEPGDHFVIVDGPDFQWSVQIDNASVSAARKFVTAVNSTARQYEAMHPKAQETQESDDTAAPTVADQLAHLASLHESGALDDEEYTAAKHQLLGI